MKTNPRESKKLSLQVRQATDSFLTKKERLVEATSLQAEYVKEAMLDNLIVKIRGILK